MSEQSTVYEKAQANDALAEIAFLFCLTVVSSPDYEKSQWILDQSCAWLNTGKIRYPFRGGVW